MSAAEHNTFDEKTADMLEEQTEKFFKKQPESIVTIRDYLVPFFRSTFGECKVTLCADDDGLTSYAIVYYRCGEFDVTMNNWKIEECLKYGGEDYNISFDLYYCQPPIIYRESLKSDSDSDSD
jgi:hypothetical protein